MSTVEATDASMLKGRAKSRLFAGGLLVLAGTGVWQASNFLFNAIAARTLTPERYGDLAAAVGLIYLVSPIVVSIQTVGSRTATALYAAGRARELRGLVRFYALRIGFAAVVLGALVALLSGPAAQVLHLASPLPLALVGVVIVLSVLTHIQRGVFQGLQRFAVLGGSSAIEGITKLAAAVVLLRWVWPSESGAILAFGVASAVGLTFNWSVLRRLPDTTDRVVPLEHPYRYSLETLGSLVLLAMLLSTDVIAANRYLPARTAGLYAALALTGKTVFFATSAFTTLAFPVFSDRQDRGQDSRRPLLALLATVGAISGVLVVTYSIRPTLIVHAIFGSRYEDAATFVPWITAVFAGYSFAYLVAMYLLSQRRVAGTRVLAVAVVVQLAGLRILHSQVTQLMTVQTIVFAVTAVVLTAIAFLGGRRREPESTPMGEEIAWQP